jgi:uncharacterized protein YciI
MLFVIHALDKADNLQIRARHYRDHRAHLDRAPAEGIEIVSAGTLVADDGETPIGSLLVLDAPSRGAVEAFCDVDPYHVGGVWERVQIHPYIRRRGWASPTSTGI